MRKKKPSPVTVDEWPLQPENPARRALRENGITRLKQLKQYTEKELLKLHGVGPKGIRMLREALAEMGLGFAKASTKGVKRKSE